MLAVIGVRKTFPHGLGQNRKSSTRAYDFRFAPESGHCATESALACQSADPSLKPMAAGFGRMRMNLLAPCFSSPCPTPKPHEFSSGSSPECRAARRHRIRCLSSTVGRGAKLAFELGGQIAQRATRPRRPRDNLIEPRPSCCCDALCRLMALFGHGAMSVLSPLSGVERVNE